MRCTKAMRYIDLQAHTGLEQAAEVLRPHLIACPRCRAHFEQAQKLQALLTPASPPEFPSWLHEKIMHQARMHEPQRAILRRHMRLQMIPAAAAILLSLYFGSMAGIKAYESGFSTDDAEVASYQDDSYEVSSFGQSTIFDLSSATGEYSE
ncbi:MAG: hypothetical protein U1B83_00655 [Candidatus Cloacimonadaceae bacterium]|nr:hypothetical protein [Candidatus Cloacimonadaceae bacterium]